MFARNGSSWARRRFPGIWRIYSDGFDGTWNIEIGNKFAWQLVLAVLGIVLLFFASLLANRAPEKPKDDAVNREKQQLAEQLAAVNSDLSNRLGQIERTLDDLKTTCRAEKCPVKDVDKLFRLFDRQPLVAGVFERPGQVGSNPQHVGVVAIRCTFIDELRVRLPTPVFQLLARQSTSF